MFSWVQPHRHSEVTEAVAQEVLAADERAGSLAFWHLNVCSSFYRHAKCEHYRAMEASTTVFEKSLGGQAMCRQVGYSAGTFVSDIGSSRSETVPDALELPRTRDTGSGKWQAPSGDAPQKKLRQPQMSRPQR